MRTSLRFFLVMLFAVCPVMATASTDGVRFTTSPTVTQMRIEVRSAGGTLLYDSEWRDGNLLDWPLLDTFGQPLAYGSYHVRVLTKDLSGQSSEKEASLQVVPGGAAIDGQANERVKITVTAHDGETGQLITTSGDLSFRFGDFLNRKDAEVMRLTAQGNLGIGTDKPQARLDVNGLIRTSEGIVFPDGSIQRSAAMPSIVRMRPSSPETDKKLKPKSDISGAGTTNQVTKWLDGPAGTVGDSAIAEVGGKVGIGTTNPGAQLHIYGASNLDVFAGMGPDVISGPGFNYGYAGNSFGVGAGFFNVRPATGATGVNPSLRFMTVDTERMIITNAGSVGIGTSTPGQKLDVVGGDIRGSAAIDAGTQFNIAGQRMLSIPGTTNLFLGTLAGAANTTAFSSVFVGWRAGLSNTTGYRNTFVGTQAGQSSSTGNQNSFFGTSAGFLNTTGFSNAFFGSFAGQNNTTASGNSYFGGGAGGGATGGSNAYFGYATGGGSGSRNSFFGEAAGTGVTTAQDDVLIGQASGFATTTGFENVFVGTQSGTDNTTGSGNTIVGAFAGAGNTSESENTFVGHVSHGSAGINGATAIGSGAIVTQANSLVLGATVVSVGIGVSAPKSKLQVDGGDTYMSTGGKGVILKSPDGLTCKRLSIDNTGTLITTVVACP